MSKDNVNHLISQMKAAVKSAQTTQSSQPPMRTATPPVRTSAPAAPARASSSAEGADSPAVLSLINELMQGVETRFGIKPGSLVERKLVRILKDMPIEVLRDWVLSMNSCSSEHSEWQSLVENLTVHETYFCRDPDLMGMLADEILPNLIASRDSHQQLQVWSAASSTGEEVCTTAPKSHPIAVGPCMCWAPTFPTKRFAPHVRRSTVTWVWGRFAICPTPGKTCSRR